MSNSGQDHPAADHCRSLDVDGKTDWYLPAHAELCLAWVNCADVFTKEGYYWSSTQHDRTSAFVQDFEFGYSYTSLKATQRRVRAVRRSFL